MRTRPPPIISGGIWSEWGYPLMRNKALDAEFKAVGGVRHGGDGRPRPPLVFRFPGHPRLVPHVGKAAIESHVLERQRAAQEVNEMHPGAAPGVSTVSGSKLISNSSRESRVTACLRRRPCRHLWVVTTAWSERRPRCSQRAVG